MTDEQRAASDERRAATARRLLACHHALIPSTTIRLRRPLEAWARLTGGEVRLVPEHLASDRDLLWADAVVLSRGATVFSERLLRRARHWGRPLVNDLDDHLLAITPEAESAAFYRQSGTRRRMRRLLREADVTVVSTARLGEAVARLCRRVVVIPNAAPALESRRRGEAGPGEPRATRDEYRATALLASSDRLGPEFLRRGLAEALEACPALTVLSVGGALPGFEHPRLRRLPLMPLDDYLLWLSEQPLAFALAPLERSPFHDCKSDIKFLDFAAAGIPGLYSRSPVYEESVSAGRGLLVENSAEAWRDAILWAVNHPEEMRALAEAAQAHVREARGADRAAQRWAEVVSALPCPARTRPAGPGTPIPGATPRAPARLRVLVFAPEPVTENFTGPTLRAVALARELGREFDVTLGARESEAPDPRGRGERRTAELLAGEPFAVAPWTRRTAAALARRFDVVISTGLQYPASEMVRARFVQVFDLYDPVLFEILAGEAHVPMGNGHHLGFLRRLTALALLCADHIVCASERQRDLWLGALYIAGRLGRRHGPLGVTPAELFSIVPFGHDGLSALESGAAGPRGRGAFRGVHPGIGAEDRLILWGGGVWNWLDPETLVRAVAEIARERSDVKLLFLGLRPSDAPHHDHALGERMIALARELGVLDRAVFFNRGWTPLAGRAEALAEADLAVCTAPDTAENHFAFRARLVDAIGAGVPIICTRGSALAAFAEENEVGLAVAPGDVRALREAILEALRPERQRQMRRHLALCRDTLRWDVCAEPLRAFCRRVARGEHVRAAAPARERWRWYLRYKIPSLIDAALSR